MTLFRNRVFSDVIKLKRSYWIRIGSNIMIDALLRRQRFRHRHTHTEGELHVMTEPETGVMYLQAKECQGLAAIARS